MQEVVDVPVVDLLLDPGNARLVTELPSQQEIALALANQQKENIVRLAGDIVENGLDPTTLSAIVSTGDQRKRYRVLEGNRRILALKALETPSLIAPALNSAAVKKLNVLANRYADEPIEKVRCILFDSEKEAEHWIELRHTGQNLGVGLVEWGSDEKDRYAARHGGRSPAGQVLDFVEKHGELSDEARSSTRKVITSVKRLISTPEVRHRLGVDVVGGNVVSSYPKVDIARSLGRVVDDLKTGAITVKNIYHAEDRENYVDSLPRTVLPKKKNRLSSPLSLEQLASGRTPSRTTPPPRRRRKPVKLRTSLIPRTCLLNVDPPRINAIFNELLSMSVEQYPNACSVLFRVFVELSVDHYLTDRRLLPDEQIRNLPLAKRLKRCAAYLNKRGKIDSRLKAAIERIADSKQVLAASTPTWNKYVHNEYVFPRASELRVAWDEIQPFIERIWPN